MPLDRRYLGIEMGAMREAWQEDALSVHFKAGTAQNGHMDLDAGTFVLDALGERWFADLGERNRAEWPSFFSTWGPRWTYYTKRAEGHNTLVIPGHAAELLQESGHSSVYVEASNMSIRMPVSVINQLGERINELGWEDGQIVWQAAELEASEAKWLLQQAQRKSGASLTPATRLHSFHLSVQSADGAVESFSAFNEPITVELPL